MTTTTARGEFVLREGRVEFVPAPEVPEPNDATERPLYPIELGRIVPAPCRIVDADAERVLYGIGDLMTVDDAIRFGIIDEGDRGEWEQRLTESVAQARRSGAVG